MDESLRDKVRKTRNQCSMCDRGIGTQFMVCSTCKALTDKMNSAWRMYARPSNNRS
jgi:hypothetical protein